MPGCIILRRQVDARFVVVDEERVDLVATGVMARLEAAMRIADPPEPLKPGTKRRPLLLDLEGRTPNHYFALLARSLNHRPALLALGEVYLAMPRPDDNFVSDFQTANLFKQRTLTLVFGNCIFSPRSASRVSRFFRTLPPRISASNAKVTPRRSKP